jgi:hypothetical protein
MGSVFAPTVFEPRAKNDILVDFEPGLAVLPDSVLPLVLQPCLRKLFIGISLFKVRPPAVSPLSLVHLG